MDRQSFTFTRWEHAAARLAQLGSTALLLGSLALGTLSLANLTSAPEGPAPERNVVCGTVGAPEACDALMSPLVGRLPDSATFRTLNAEQHLAAWLADESVTESVVAEHVFGLDDRHTDPRYWQIRLDEVAGWTPLGLDSTRVGRVAYALDRESQAYDTAHDAFLTSEAGAASATLNARAEAWHRDRTWARATQGGLAAGLLGAPLGLFALLGATLVRRRTAPIEITLTPHRVSVVQGSTTHVDSLFEDLDEGVVARIDAVLGERGAAEDRVPLRIALRERVQIVRKGEPVPEAVRAQLAKLTREA
ncbi:MAG: hypothetical protein R3F61_07215 [Myxococcota bacterium]